MPGVKEATGVQTGKAWGATPHTSHEVINIAVKRKKINLFINSHYTPLKYFKRMSKLKHICGDADMFLHRHRLIMEDYFESLFFSIVSRSSPQPGSVRMDPSGKMIVGTLRFPLFNFITNSVASSLPSSPMRRYSMPLASKNAFARWQSGQNSVVYITICDGFVL